MAKKASKSEARLQRQLERLAKNQSKNARLSEDIEIKDKYIRSTVKPPIARTPRSNSPENYKNFYFSWCDTQSDTCDDWSWSESRQWTHDEYEQTIKPHMDAHINNSWNDVEIKTYNGKGKFRKLLNKYQSLDTLCEEAQIRWYDLEQLAEFEELFRLRLGDKKRIWGIRIQYHFYLVWYERNHKICPIKD
jgi:hypothetical protein